MPLRFLVSAGPTREFIDPVRFISNPSTGRMGFALAREILAAGHECVLVSGPVALEPPEGARYVPVVSAQDMLEALQKEFSGCDVLVMTAAVSDFKPARYLPHKEHKAEAGSCLELERTPDILMTLAPEKAGQVVVGFAAETEDLEASGRRKLLRKGLDMIVANDVSSPRAGFASRDLDAVLIYPDRPQERLGLLSKEEIARRIIDFALQKRGEAKR